jgi:hypothetical protein
MSSEKPGARPQEFARILYPDIGRTDEFRFAERMRGDSGGGPEGDGVPDVPHRYGESARGLEHDRVPEYERGRARAGEERGEGDDERDTAPEPRRGER